MSLPSHEQSRFSGQPVDLYLFRYGPNDGDFHAYTSCEHAITFGVITYQPLPIDRDKLTSSGNFDRSNIKIAMPQTADLARLFLGYPLSYVTSLIMYQGHANDNAGDFRVVWTGHVISCMRRGAKAELTCEPVSSSLRRNGLRRRYQYGCPHVLFSESPGCGANKAAATRTAEVDSVNGLRVTLVADWGDVARAAKYVQGLAEWTSDTGAREIRTILRSENAGLTFLLDGRPRGLGAGDSIDMVLGCNHRSGTTWQPDGDCGPLHSNIHNFGGQERIPFKNPIGSFSNNFY